MNENNEKLMDKKIEDLTVADYVKLNVGALAIMAGGAVLLVAVPEAVNKVKTKLAQRKIEKLENKKITLVKE